MRCPRCQHDNREGRRFCAQCGAGLAAACPSCGFSNQPGERFCGGCGTSLGQSDATVAPEHATREAERRQLTVMFCDLVESTELSARLDPEVLRDIVRVYQQTCDRVISSFDGHIAQYLGDGLLVYFGYPAAHEDDAQRAVRAALRILAVIEGLNPRLGRERDVKLAVRLGIHTGLVVVGEVGGESRQEALALGETPNVAARLQSLAEAGTVVVSHATYRLVHGLFTFKDLGSHPVKGLPAPLRVYRVLGETAVESRLELRAHTELTPLVGREQEVGLLLDRWARVKDGFGQVVLVTGEAGIGKSRLIQALKERVAAEPHLRWECRCSPYHQDSALYPVIDLMQRALAFGRDESPAEKLRKIEANLERRRLADPETVALWASLLAVPLPDHYAPLNLTPERQKRKTLEALLRLLLALVAEVPVLFIVEDLHWVDPSTLELLDLVLQQVPTTSVMTLLTFRPDFRPPWAARAHVTSLTVSRFTRRQTEVMVEQVTRGKRLPAEVLQQVVANTDGVPLFVEELTKMMLESGLLRDHGDRYEITVALPPLAIPASLQDSLMARLDRLAAVKDVAQLGAALGRSFSYELLRAVSPQNESTIERALAKLVEAELLYQRGVPPEATYHFKHALIQEAAYQSLLKSTRQHYHQRIAQVLEAQFSETTETQPELVAHHYTEAGLREPAVRYWQRAGERSRQRSANVEAIGHLTKALELLAALPETRERAQRELELQIALGNALMAIRGYAAPDVEKVYRRASELCQQVGEISRLFPTLYGLWAFHFVGGKHQTAYEVGEEFLRLAQREGHPAGVVAHRTVGWPLLCMGEVASANEHCEQIVALYDPQQHRSLAFLYGQDPGAAGLSYGSWAQWLLGYPDQALQRSEKAVALAKEASHPLSLAYALGVAAMLLQFRREATAVQEQAEAGIKLCVELEMPLFRAMATVLRGWALTQRGLLQEGIAQIREGLDAHQATGAAVYQPYFRVLLAEGYGKAGQADEGLRLLGEALSAAHTRREVYYEAEIHRSRGELLLVLSADNQTEAEACFHRALDVARRQHAKSLELRAAMSLSRLLQKHGKHDEARGVLAEVYDWFTEGFDTADLKDAKALLTELSGG